MLEFRIPTKRYTSNTWLHIYIEGPMTNEIIASRQNIFIQSYHIVLNLTPLQSLP